MANRNIVKQFTVVQNKPKTQKQEVRTEKKLPLNIAQAIQKTYINNAPEVKGGEFSHDPTKKLNGWAKSNL